MKTIIVLLSFLILTCSVSGAAEDEKISFWPPPSSEFELRLYFQSQGCFHHDRYMFIISSSQLRVSAWRASDDVNISRDPIQLSQTDLQQLQKLLEFYRSNQLGGCTTVDTLTANLVREGRVVKEEKYIDGSCSYFRDDDFLTLPMFVRRIIERQKKENDKQ